jgi:Zn-dependent M28 family amino/carboxypeptidase
MLARIASIVATTVGFVGLAAALIADWLTAIPGTGGIGTSASVPVWTIATAIVAVPLAVCFTGDKSAGAVDNASGVITILLATRTIPQGHDLGVIITSAEELGLAGARAYLQSKPEKAIALNCDTVDDRGVFLCMAQRKSGPATRAVGRAASSLGFSLRVRRLIPGILADSIAFSESGWDALTLSRGNIGTLARVHTSSDTRDRLDGSGIAQAALLLAATIEELS